MVQYVKGSQWIASRSGFPSVAPYTRVAARHIGIVYATPLDPIGRGTIKPQGTDTNAIAIAPNGGCGVASGMAYGAVITFATTQQKDVYNLQIAGAPAEGQDAITYSFRQGQTTTLGYRPLTAPSLPWLTDIATPQGTALGQEPYGTYDFTDPATGITHASPNVKDKIVKLHKLKVQYDPAFFAVDARNRLTWIGAGGSGAGGGAATLGLYKSGFGIQITAPLPPTGIVATAIAGSGLGIGLYDYIATKRTITGKESGPSVPFTMTTTTGNQEGSLVFPTFDPVNDPLSIGYSLYRSPVGGAGTPISQCAGVTASVDGTGKTVYRWSGSGCDLTYDASILAQPGLAGPPATPPLPIDPATNTVTTFDAVACSFSSGGSPFDPTLPQTYPAGQGYHWVADMGAGTYLDTASDASIATNKRPPTDNTPEIDTLLARTDDTATAAPFSALENIAPHGAIKPLRRGNKVRTDDVTIDINLPNNWLEVIGITAKGQPCVDGNPCPVPSGGAPPPSSGPYGGPGTTLNPGNPGDVHPIPPGGLGRETPGVQCDNITSSVFTTPVDFAMYQKDFDPVTTVDNYPDGFHQQASFNPLMTTGMAFPGNNRVGSWMQCNVQLVPADTTGTLSRVRIGIGNLTATCSGCYVDSQRWSDGITGTGFAGVEYNHGTWNVVGGGGNTYYGAAAVQPGLEANVGIFVDCAGMPHIFLGLPDGNLTEVTYGDGTHGTSPSLYFTVPDGAGTLAWGWSELQDGNPNYNNSNTLPGITVQGIKTGMGLPGDLTIGNFDHSGNTYVGSVPPCPTVIDPTLCTQWTQGYNDFLAAPTATVPPTCPYGPNPFSDQCKAYDMGWWDAYNTAHAAAQNPAEGSNGTKNSLTSPTQATPGTVPLAYAPDYQAGYAAHQAGGSNTCPATDTALQCQYWTQGWQAATGDNTSSTTTNAPVPISVPTINQVDYEAGYNAFINGFPITCPGGDTATQCQYYQMGWTDAASVKTTSSSTTGSPSIGGTVPQGTGLTSGGGGTTGAVTNLTPPSGDQCTGTAGAYPGALGAMSGYQVGGMLCYESGTGFYWYNDGTGQSGIFQYVSGTWSQVGGGVFSVYSPNGLPFGSKYSGIVGGTGSTGSGSTGTVSGAGGGSTSGIIQSGDVFVQGNESITGNLEVQSNETVLGTLLAKAGLIAQGPISSTGAVSGLSFQGTKIALTYASTISLNPTLGELFTTATTNAVGNATINAASAGLAGRRIYVQITNDATAPRTITFGTSFSSIGPLIGTISKTAVIEFESDGTGWFEVGRSAGSGGGVTSVGLTVPSFLAVAGSPVTGTGTLALSLATEPANTFLAGPTGGAAATPTNRVIMAPDLPLGSVDIDGTVLEGDLLYHHTPTALTIGFIGDSITADTPTSGNPPPANAATDLSVGGLAVTANNRGVGGTDTADWLPSNGSGPYAAAKAALIAAGASIVHIMLGANDSTTLARTSQAAYQSNVAALCADLNAAGMICVLSYPMYTVPGSISALFDATSDTLLQQYQTAINALVNGTTIRQGDTTAYTYFQAHTSELSDGVHPTATGSVDLARLWANALSPIVTAPLKRRALGANHTVLQSDGTDPVYGLITNSNVDAAAAIALSKLGQSGATSNQVPTWNGTAWVPADAPSSSGTSGTDHLHGLARWVASGGTTVELPDLAEYVQMVFDNGSAVDETTVTLSADRSQLVFATAPTTGHVLQAEYVIARI